MAFVLSLLFFLHPHYQEAPNGLAFYSFNEDLDFVIDYWPQEVEERFNPQGTVLIVGHGASFLGVWMVIPDLERGDWIPVVKLAEMYRNMNPNKRIVLLVCNPRGSDIYKPNVFYFKSLVWTTPDSNNIFGRKDTQPNFGYVGNIDEAWVGGQPAFEVTK